MPEIPIGCDHFTRVVPVMRGGHWINLKGRILVRSGDPGYSHVRTVTVLGLVVISPVGSGAGGVVSEGDFPRCYHHRCQQDRRAAEHGLCIHRYRQRSVSWTGTHTNTHVRRMRKEKLDK